MSTVVNNLRFLKNAVVTSIKSAKEYKVSFIIQTIFMAINNTAFLFSWYVIFKRAGGDELVNYSKMLELCAISTIGYGCTYFFFGGVQYINRFLIDGDLDIYLLKPKNILVNVLTSKCIFSACGDMLFGIIVSAIISKSVINFIQFICYGIYSMVFLLAVEIIYRSICVWIGDTENLASRIIFGIFITITTYPIEIFSFGIKLISFTIIPAYYAAHLPLQIIENFSIKKIAVFILSGILLLIFSVKLFNMALKRYESGNSISLRM